MLQASELHKAVRSTDQTRLTCLYETHLLALAFFVDSCQSRTMHGDESVDEAQNCTSRLSVARFLECNYQVHVQEAHVLLFICTNHTKL